MRDRPEADAQKKTAGKSVPRKLSYKDQRLLDALPQEIEALEELQSDLETKISAPDFYAQAHDIVQDALAQLSSTQETLDQRMELWSELADRQQSYDQSRKK